MPDYFHHYGKNNQDNSKTADFIILRLEDDFIYLDRQCDLNP